jgi:hypothetical protein
MSIALCDRLDTLQPKHQPSGTTTVHLLRPFKDPKIFSTTPPTKNKRNQDEDYIAFRRHCAASMCKLYRGAICPKQEHWQQAGASWCC